MGFSELSRPAGAKGPGQGESGARAGWGSGWASVSHLPECHPVALHRVPDALPRPRLQHLLRTHSGSEWLEVTAKTRAFVPLTRDRCHSVQDTRQHPEAPGLTGPPAIPPAACPPRPWLPHLQGAVVTRGVPGALPSRLGGDSPSSPTDPAGPWDAFCRGDPETPHRRLAPERRGRGPAWGALRPLRLYGALVTPVAPCRPSAGLSSGTPELGPEGGRAGPACPPQGLNPGARNSKAQPRECLTLPRVSHGHRGLTSAFLQPRILSCGSFLSLFLSLVHRGALTARVTPSCFLLEGGGITWDTSPDSCVVGVPAATFSGVVGTRRGRGEQKQDSQSHSRA